MTPIPTAVAPALEVDVIAGKGPGSVAGRIWLRPARGGGNGEPPLTRARIVEGAVALLDDEGMDRLTMRRLAERLQAGTTTLYWHVATKDDVIDLAVDAVFGEPRLPARTDSPREDIAALLHAWRQAILRHPWAAEIPARRLPLMGPNFLTWMDFLQSALLRTGLPEPLLNSATWALYNHVMGSTTAQTSLRLSTEDVQAGRSYLESRRERYPTVAAHNYIADEDWDTGFATGLEFLLDGMEARTRR